MYIKGIQKPENFGKTRSEHEKNLRKEWGSTMTDAQLDKLEYSEKKRKWDGDTKNFTRGQDIDKIKTKEKVCPGCSLKV